MNVRVRPSADETRQRIMEVAEEHFRRIGYAKTAVADIAAELGMSPANVYRFFESKDAIRDAICHRLLEQEHAMVEAIIASSGTAAERLERIVLEINRYNRSQFVKDKRIHEMVEVAIAENWEAVQNHCDALKGYYATVIAEGIASGEFAKSDPVTTAESFFVLCAGLCHPTLIAQNNDEDAESRARGAAALLVRSLRP
jgi:AcrR family transcriptional regulator